MIWRYSRVKAHSLAMDRSLGDELRLIASLSPCWHGRPIKMVCLIDPDGFLLVLGDFPTLATDNFVEAPVILRSREMDRVADTITTKCLLFPNRDKKSSYFTGELVLNG